MAEVPRIFISATTRDLGSVRRKVKDRLVTLGYLPVEQEHFGLHPGTIRSLLQDKIEQSDGVVHIVGELYGTGPPAGTEDRRSYTQMEYDLARERNKPLYLIVCDETFPYDAHDREGDAERLHQQARRQEILQGEHKYDLVKSVQEIELLLSTLSLRLDELQREARQTHAEIAAHEHKSKRRFVVLGALLAFCCVAAGLIYWQIDRQRAELKRTYQLQQAMLVRMLPANDPLRADQLRQNFTDAEAYRRLLTRELAPQFGLTADEAERRLEREANVAARDTKRDSKDKAQQLITAGRFDEANRTLDEAITSASGPLRELLTAKGDAQFAAFHLKEAEEAYRQAANLVDEQKDVNGWTAVQARIAESLEAQGRFVESEPIRSRIAEVTLREMGADNPDLAPSLNNYASVLWHLRRLSEAEPLYRRALTLTEKKFGTTHSNVTAIVNNLASVYSVAGDYRQAESLYQRALQTREKSLGPDHPEVAESLNNLGELYIREGRYAEAESSLQRAIDIWRKKVPDNPNAAVALRNLGAAYRNQGKLEPAKEAYEMALSIRERIFGPDHPDVARSLHDLGLIYYRQNNAVDAEKYFERALAIQEKAMPDSLELALTLHNLASVQAAGGKPNEAEKSYQREIALREKIQGQEHPGLALALESYSAFLRQIGKDGEAANVLTRAANIRAKLGDTQEK